MFHQPNDKSLMSSRKNFISREFDDRGVYFYFVIVFAFIACDSTVRMLSTFGSPVWPKCMCMRMRVITTLVLCFAWTFSPLTWQFWRFWHLWHSSRYSKNQPTNSNTEIYFAFILISIGAICAFICCLIANRRFVHITARASHAFQKRVTFQYHYFHYHCYQKVTAEKYAQQLSLMGFSLVGMARDGALSIQSNTHAHSFSSIDSMDFVRRIVSSWIYRYEWQMMRSMRPL